MDATSPERFGHATDQASWPPPPVTPGLDPGGPPYPQLWQIHQDAEALLAGVAAGHPQLLRDHLTRMRAELDQALLLGQRTGTVAPEPRRPGGEQVQLLIHDRTGVLSAHRSRDGAIAAMAAEIREHWASTASDHLPDQPPGRDEELIELYQRHMNAELHIQAAPLRA
jgi:hypothetical protein